VLGEALVTSSEVKSPPVTSIHPRLMVHKMQKELMKTSYTKEYRTLLEKLLEIHVRISEVNKGEANPDKSIQQKIEPIIDECLAYFHTNIKKTLKIQRDLDGQRKAGTARTDDGNTQA